MKIHYGRVHKADREERDNCSNCGKNLRIEQQRRTMRERERECDGKER